MLIWDGEDGMRPASLAATALAGVLLLMAGCTSVSKKEYKLGQNAQALQDYETALIHYERALKADPTNPQYKIGVAQMRFNAAAAQVANMFDSVHGGVTGAPKVPQPAFL